MVLNKNRRWLWAYLGLVIVTFAVYSQVRHFEFVNFDDPDYVDNPHVRAGLSLAGAEWAATATDAANWFPLTWISHMLDRELFGGDSGSPHLMNVALHAIATLFLFAAMSRVTGMRSRSALVAAIFALHPLHIESVAWVAERKDVLSALFFFATMWAYARYVERRSVGRYIVAALLMCCGLMSKPTTVTLPFVLLLLDYWPFRRSGGIRLWLEKIPLILLSIAASVVTFLVQRHGGAVLSLGEIPFGTRLANAAVSYAVYILNFLWPVNLAVFYPYPASIPPWKTIAAALALAAITVGVLLARKRYLIAGWLWFLGMLLPTIGLIQAGIQSRADRYTYLPLTGLAIMLVWGLAELLEPRLWGRKALAIASLAAIAALAWTTYFDLQPWHDSISLFRRALQVTQGNYLAANNLGVALRRSGRIQEAIPLFESAFRDNPAYAEAQSNLGEALLAESKVKEALPHILEALRLDPNLAVAHVNFGAALSRSGRFAEAAGQYQIALKLQPDQADAHAGLGIMLTELGRYPEALPELLEALQMQPRDANSHYNLGRLYGLMGRPDDAIDEFAETIHLDPNDPQAHFNLGTALAGKGRIDEAIEQFRVTARLSPGDLNAHFNLGSALATEGRYEEAIPEFSEVVRLNPAFADAQRALQYCLAQRKPH